MTIPMTVTTIAEEAATTGPGAQEEMTEGPAMIEETGARLEGQGEAQHLVIIHLIKLNVPLPFE
jgi:hypothetical protein